MNAPSVDIKDILVAESSLGLIFTTDLFISITPTTPDDCVTVIDTTGSSPDTTLANDLCRNPSLQIRVRNNDYRVGWDLANNILEVLHGRANETWNTTLYMVILAMSEVGYLGMDDNNRHLFSINFNLKRR